MEFQAVKHNRIETMFALESCGRVRENIDLFEIRTIHNTLAFFAPFKLLTFL